jgi:hypothetical protein
MSDFVRPACEKKASGALSELNLDHISCTANASGPRKRVTWLFRPCRRYNAPVGFIKFFGYSTQCRLRQDVLQTLQSGQGIPPKRVRL